MHPIGDMLSLYIRKIYPQVDTLDLVYCWHDLSRLQELVQPGPHQYLPFTGFGRAGASTHVLIEKLLTPMALTLPVSNSSSIFAQVSLKVTSERWYPPSAQCTGQGFSPTSGKYIAQQGRKRWNVTIYHNQPTQRGYG